MLDPYLVEIAGELDLESRAEFRFRQDRILCFRNQICIPNLGELKDEVLNEAHRSKYIINPPPKDLPTISFRLHDTKCFRWIVSHLHVHIPHAADGAALA